MGVLKKSKIWEEEVTDEFVDEIDRHINGLSPDSFFISVQHLFGAKVLFEYFMKTHLTILNYNVDFKLPLCDTLNNLNASQRASKDD